MSNNKRDREEKLQEESFPKVHVNCDTEILWKMHSNYWRYWKNDIEIFTYFYKLKNIKINRLTIWMSILFWKKLKNFFI